MSEWNMYLCKQKTNDLTHLTRCLRRRIETKCRHKNNDAWLLIAINVWNRNNGHCLIHRETYYYKQNVSGASTECVWKRKLVVVCRVDEKKKLQTTMMCKLLTIKSQFTLADLFNNVTQFNLWSDCIHIWLFGRT